jgi:hypothetical protein
MTAFARQCTIVMVLGLSCVGAAHASAVGPGMPQIPALPQTGERIVLHDQAGIALHGFDPVGYFAAGRPVGGLAQFELLHEGVVWRFASAANREAFVASPDIYHPLFGGHDPVGAAQGRAVEGRPEYFLIVGDRLMLFRTRESRNDLKSNPGLIETAQGRWPEIEHQLAR